MIIIKIAYLTPKPKRSCFLILAPLILSFFLLLGIFVYADTSKNIGSSVISKNNIDVNFIHTYSGFDRQEFLVNITNTGLDKTFSIFKAQLQELNFNSANMEIYQKIKYNEQQTIINSCNVSFKKDICGNIGNLLGNGSKDYKCQTLDFNESVQDAKNCGSYMIYIPKTRWDLIKYGFNVEIDSVQIKTNEIQEYKIIIFTKKDNYGLLNLNIDGTDYWDKTHSSFYNSSWNQRYNITINTPDKYINWINISNTTCYNTRNSTRLVFNGSEYLFEWKQSGSGVTTDTIEFINNGTNDFILYCNATGLVSGTWGNQTVFLLKDDFADSSIDSNKWNISGNPPIVEKDGWIYLSGGDAWFVKYMKSRLNYTFRATNSLYYGGEFNASNSAQNHVYGLGFGFTYNSANSLTAYYFGDSTNYYARVETPAHSLTMNTQISNTGKYTYMIKANVTNGVVFYVNNSGGGAPGVIQWGGANASYDNLYIFFDNWESAIYTQINYIYLSNYEFNVSRGLISNSVLGIQEQGITPNQPPILTFDYTQPNLFNPFSAFGSIINVSYNITDSLGIQNNTLQIYYKTNLSNEYDEYVNGSGVNTFDNKSYFSGIEQKYTFRLSDNDVFPATYAINEKYMENTTHIKLNGVPFQAYRIKLQNISNTENISFLEIMGNSNNQVDFYRCNSSASNGLVSSLCDLFYQLPSMKANHTHSIYSNHTVIPVNLRLNNGDQFVIAGNNLNMWYIANISRVDESQTSNNNGLTWSNLSGTIDAHLHQYSQSTQFCFYANATNTVNLTGQSILTCKTLQYTNFPPSNVNVFRPINAYYRINMSINYTASTPFLNNNIVYYNISLVNLINQPLYFVSNNSLYLNYVLDTRIYTDSNYKVSITACDNNSLCSISYSEEFNIKNTPPSITVILPINNSNYTTNPLIYILDVSPDGISCILNNDSVNNISVSCNTDSVYYIDGLHNAKFTVLDVVGNSNSTSIIYFNINTTLPPPPSPANITYSANYSGLANSDLNTNTTTGVLLWFVFILIVALLVIFGEYLRVGFMWILSGICIMILGILITTAISWIIGLIIILLGLVYIISAAFRISKL